tara:strand:+ start:308 stop:1045 length:738 start_codon:yes stop_codon:yes gene_type:complete
MRSHRLRAAAGGGSSLPIEESGLDIYLDPNNPSSYSGSGTTWTNLSTSGNFGNAILKTSSGLNTYTSSGSPKYFTNLRAYIPLPSTRTVYYPLSYSVWSYPTQLTGYHSLVDQGDDDFLFAYYAGSSPNRILLYDPSHEATGYQSAITTNTWYNFTVTHTLGQNIKFYQDGVLISTHTETSTNYNETFNNWSFGAGNVRYGQFGDADGNEPFVGRIGAIMVYNRPLTATEVTSNYNALKSTYGHS